MKKRLMAMLLAFVMMVCQIPTDGIIALAETEAEFTYTLSGSDATITGYTDTTVTSLVIPETITAQEGTYNVVAIADYAFSWDNYPNLTDIAVRGENVTIGTMMCGFESTGVHSRNDNMVLWGNAGSTFQTYAQNNLFTFKLLTTSMTEIGSEAEIDSCYTEGGAFKVFTYLSIEGTDVDAEDIMWESENTEQATIVAFGTPTKQNDGTYKAEATVRVLTKGDGTCKLYAYTRGLTEKKEIELTIKQSASSVTYDAAIYTGITNEEGEVTGYELCDVPDTFCQNDIITADEGKYLWISPSVVGSDEDGVEGWTAGDSESNLEYVGSHNSGWLFSLKGTTGDGYTYIRITSESLVRSKVVNIKITLPATGITMTYGEEKTIISDEGNLLLIEGQREPLNAALTPSNSTDSVTWTSANTNVATIAEDGTITTHNSGTSLITCKIKDCDAAERDLQATFTLSVYKKVLYSRLGIATTKQNASPITELDMEAGTECQLYPIELDSVQETPNEPLIWTSSNEKVATVDDSGKITTKDGVTGTAIISASALRSNGANVTASIIVKTYVKATSISLSPVTIPNGKSKVISYKVLPSTASEEIIWTPEDSSVVTVKDNNDGTITVTALKEGNTTIQGRSKSGGATVSTNVIVEKYVPMQTLNIVVREPDSYVRTYVDEENITVYEVAKGGTIELMPSFTPNSQEEKSNDELEWWYEAVANITLHEVNDEGNYVITAKAVGTQLFTLESTNGLVAKCKIKVIVPATKVDICSNNSSTQIERLTVNLNELGRVNANMGSNVTDKCTWTADNDNIEFSSTTSENKEVINIRGLKPGTTIVTATAENGLKSTLEVVVVIPVTDIQFIESGKTLTSGLNILLNETKSITLNILPDNTSAQKYTWASSRGNVSITPSEDGKTATIIGYVVGTDTITVTPDIGKPKTLSVKVMQPAESISFTSEGTTINKGSSITALVEVAPTTANDGITYTVDKENIVALTPSTDGKSVKIDGIGVGTVTITATTGSGKTATMTITVVTIEASELTVTGLNVNGYAYTGAEIEPKPTVKYGATTLREGTDYELSYENNVTSSENAKVIVTGRGKYSGTLELTFKIYSKSGTSLQVKFVENNLTSMTKTYDGMVYNPLIKIVDGENTLIQGNDYDIVYPENAVNVGKYTLTINYKGNYSGTKNISYSIASKPLDDTSITVSGIDANGYAYTAEAIKPAIVVKDGTSKVLVEGTTADYTVAYSGNTKASTDTAKAKITITGKGNYKGTKSVEFVINPAPISSVTVGEIPDKTYTGKEQKPSVSLKYKDKTVTSADYELAYSGNTNTGKATIAITGKGNFTGTKYVYFNIVPKNVQGVKQTKATTTSVTLTWTKVDGGVTGYRVYSYNAKKDTYKYAGSTTKNKITIKKLKAGNDYSYVVCAYKKVDSGICEGKYSTPCAVKTTPGKPKLQKAKSSSSGAVTLTWKKTKGASSYEIYYSANGKKYKLKKTSSSTSITITGLKSKKKHFFKIKAIRNIAGKNYKSAFSKVKSVKAK